MSDKKHDKRIVIWTDLDTKMDWIKIKEEMGFSNYHDMIEDMIEVYRRNKQEVRFTG